MSKCSYNGTILYALPEWNKKTHPYALIRKKLGGDYVLILSTTLPLYGDTIESNSFGAVSYSSPHLESVSEFTLNTYAPWGELTEEDDTGISGSLVIWTNTDILNESDGTLYLAASDPIPVVTAHQLDPLSLWLGYQAGQWVARQRGKA